MQSQGPGSPVLWEVDSRHSSVPIPWWAAGTAGAGTEEGFGVWRCKDEEGSCPGGPRASLDVEISSRRIKSKACVYT